VGLPARFSRPAGLALKLSAADLIVTPLPPPDAKEGKRQFSGLQAEEENCARRKTAKIFSSGLRAAGRAEFALSVRKEEPIRLKPAELALAFFRVGWREGSDN